MLTCMLATCILAKLALGSGQSYLPYLPYLSKLADQVEKSNTVRREASERDALRRSQIESEPSLVQPALPLTPPGSPAKSFSFKRHRRESAGVSEGVEGVWKGKKVFMPCSSTSSAGPADQARRRRSSVGTLISSAFSTRGRQSPSVGVEPCARSASSRGGDSAQEACQEPVSAHAGSLDPVSSLGAEPPVAEPVQEAKWGGMGQGRWTRSFYDPLPGSHIPKARGQGVGRWRQADERDADGW